MRWWLAVVGTVLGLLSGASLLVIMFVAAPSRPGPFELMILLAITGMLIVAGAVSGFVVGWLIDVGSRKRQEG